MRRLFSVSVVLLLPAVLLAGIGDWVSVVKVTDNFKQSSYQVLSNEQYTQLTKDLWHRNRLLTKAIRLARDEWNAAEGTKTKVYPVNVTCKAEAKRLKTFPDADKAQAHVSFLEAEDAKKAEARKPKTYLGQKIEALEDEIERALTLTMTDARAAFIQDRRDEIEVLEAELAERRAKEREKEGIRSQAQSLIAAHLDKLVKESAAPSHETPKAY